MRLRAGDRLRCTNPHCRLQLSVTDLGTSKEAEDLVRCICGSFMKKLYERPTVNKLTRDSSAAEGVRRTRP
jgi:hypothetical protein